jgi:hypothetical protein
VPYVIVSDGAAAAIVMDRIFDSARGGKKYLADREGRFFGGKQFRKWSIVLASRRGRESRKSKGLEMKFTFKGHNEVFINKHLYV